MAKRYELSDEAWNVVSDLFIETHGRGRPCLSDLLMLDGVLWLLCWGAAWRDMPERFSSWANGVSTVSRLAKSGDVRSNAQTLAPEMNEEGQTDLQTWIIDSTAVRATRASSGARKKGGLTSLPITL